MLNCDREKCFTALRAIKGAEDAVGVLGRFAGSSRELGSKVPLLRKQTE
jgi:hypothetical protein